MTDIGGICFETDLGVLICKVHRTGVRPDASAIARHLRKKGHYLKNKSLTEAVAALSHLPLRSMQDLKERHPPVHLQPIQPVPHLDISLGWSCRTCRGGSLTTSLELMQRHVAKVHLQKASGHSEARPLWDLCELQTIFSMTGDTRYFRIRSVDDIATTTTTTTTINRERNDNRHESGATHPVLQSGSGRQQQAADSFVSQLRTQRLQHEADATAAANVNPDPDVKQGGVELWMRRLGLDKHVAGLHKDEMAASYKVSKAEPNTVLRDLCDVNERLLQETLRSCQLGSEQRMTDPQACRISSFWHNADPEGNARSFRRNLKQDTVKRYLAHWTQMLVFCWRGWQGKLFQGSLEDLARRRILKDRTSDSEDGKGSDDGYSSTSGYSMGSADKASYQRYFRLTNRQRSCLENFADRADSYNDGITTTSGSISSGTDSDKDDREQRLAALKEPAIALAQAIIQQHLAGSPFDSPLIAYVAMLSINRFGSWEEPGSYNSHLSALVYCGQLWIFRFACEQVDRQRSSSCVEKGQESDNDGLDEELDSQMRQYFTNTVSKPLSYILLWRRRLFSIAPITMVNRPAAWNLSKTTVTYLGHSISMDQVRLVCRKTIDRARCTLYSKLMFDVEHLPKLTPKELQENDSERTPGWWFGKHRQNATILHGHKEALAEHVASTARLREMYMEERYGPAGHTTLIWRKHSISLYRELVQEFLRDLAAAIHFSSGPPVRAPEFMSPMWQNTERLRHVQLRYGKIVLHLVEHKMMATTGKTVNNIRFLCDELGELLVNYLVYVVPLLESMAWHGGSKSLADAFLWVDADGKRWPEARFGDMLKAACKRAEVPEVGTMIWRQMSSAIINTHFDNVVDRSCLVAVALGAEESSHDIDEDGRDSLAASLVSMSNHSLRTHRMSYANDSPFANVWDGMLVRSHRASVAWANFFGLDRADEPERTDATAAIAKSSLSSLSSLSSQDSHKRGISTVSGSEVVDIARKIQNIGGSQKKRYWSGAALLAEARKLYRNDKLRWRCPEQEQALRLVANRAPEVLLILATGSGKSLTFMLGSSLPGSRTTIVIVPLVLLRLDLVRRCRLMNIEPVLWKNARDVAVGIDSSPALLFVSVEVAVGPGFRQYARRLYDTGNLERFVFDECHLIQTSNHYRKSMARLSTLRELPVPFVYMTATLPPRLEAVLCQRHYIGRASVVRGCSKRPNISYNVEHLHPPAGEAFIPYACSVVQERWNSAPTSEWKAPRVMVFLRSCDSAEEAADRLGCEFYHREIGSVREKEDRLARWISGESESPFLACTTAAGPGVDYPHVRWVVHIEDPYGLIDYAQESGRAGRDEEPAGATVFMKRDPKQGAPPTPLDHADPADDQALKDYLGGADCRRLSFARDLDESRHWKSCEVGDDLCDVCKKKQETEIGDSNDVEVQREDGRAHARSNEEAPSNGEEGQEKGQYYTTTDEEAEAEAEVEVALEKEGGVIRLHRQQMEEQHQMDEYLLRLSVVRDTCMLCRILAPGATWKHKMDDCPRQHKWEYIRSKRIVLEGRKGAKQWLPEYAACYFCGQPQEICGQWDEDRRRDGAKGCKNRDLAMPAIWGLWTAGGFDREWIKDRLEVQVEDEKEALLAAGRVIEFGGRRCVLGIRVFAALLERWEMGAL